MPPHFVAVPIIVACGVAVVIIGGVVYFVKRYRSRKAKREEVLRMEAKNRELAMEERGVLDQVASSMNVEMPTHPLPPVTHPSVMSPVPWAVIVQGVPVSNNAVMGDIVIPNLVSQYNSQRSEAAPMTPNNDNNSPKHVL
jgi:hypothetical protein